MKIVKSIKTGLLICSASLFISCSCMRVLHGMVKDSVTHMPIVGAQVSVTNTGYKRNFESDSLGKFNAYLSGGNKCPRIEASIFADGYETAEIKEPKKQDTIVVYLKRIEK